MTTRINADTNGLTETVDTSGILEIQTNGGTAIIIGVDQNANFTSTGAITVPVGTTAQRPTPVNGMMRYNSNVAVFEVYANNVWAAANVTPAPTNTVAPVISGSAVVGQNLTSTTGTWSGSPSAYFYQWRANSTAISNATANVFTLTSTQTGANITCNVTAFNVAGNSSPATSNTLGPVVLGTTVNYLIVAGGGGGGNNFGNLNSRGMGGGGAGGYLAGTTILQPANTYSITVGAGGAGGVGIAFPSTGTQPTNGSNTTFTGLTAAVGGGSGATSNQVAASGGSGGGGCADTNATGGAASPSGQGNAGGNSTDAANTGGGGGGGASGAGGAVGSGVGTGGAGGTGTASSISGSSVTYSTGGTGGASSGAASGAAGTANLGNGGGGAAGFSSGTPPSGGRGGSGVVIISYPGAQQFGGGVISTAGGNTIHTFSTSGSLVPLTALNSNYLIVAGGGGGGGGMGGGGGAGGLLSGSNVTIDSSSTYVITVGAGGAAAALSSGAQGVNGANSTWSAIANVAVGGGGAGYQNANGVTGGSGGGAGSSSGVTAGSGTAGQGFAGGLGAGLDSGSRGAGGGGGSSAVGGVGTSTTGGNGGAGTASSITGSSVTYAGGGGAGCGRSTGTPGTGGAGGGGSGTNDGSNATNGTANLGGGGGGGGESSGFVQGSGGAGGSGVVIVAYPGSTPQMAGGNVTVVSNTVVHTFTSSGYLTPFVLSTNSLRFRRSASAYLSRTPPTAGNRKTWTFSAWIKRGLLSANQYVLDAGTSPNTFLNFTTGNTLNFADYTSGPSYNIELTTTQVFRDPAAWYHIVIAVDTTQATASNRAKLYVNGSQVTAFGTATYPSQNHDTGWNNSVLSQIGYVPSTNYFDGYLAEVRNIDGQALTPNSFGSFNQYGVWQPVAYAGSYGTNGFYLPFTNTANTTALGYDFSPQGNNWTPTNISLTAGSTYDSMTDVPTLTSANVANYAVLNPLFDASVSNSNGNLQTVIGTGSISTVPATMGFTSGKYYCEVTYVATGANGLTVGVTQSNLSTANQYNWAAGGVGYRSSNGYSNTNGAGQVAYGATWTTGDVIGIAVDTTANTITFYKNGTSQGALTLPTLATGASWLFSFSNITSGGTQTMAANFGQQPWAYTPPTSHVGVNTYNI
jgi:hypothetical protein